MAVGSTTLGAIKSAAQQRADMTGGTFITDAEWTAMCNASLQQLHEKLVEAYGADYELATAYSITTDGTNDHYDLPADFFKLLGVDLQLSATGNAATGYITLWRFNFAARNQFTLPNIQTLWGRTNMRYRLAGTQIWFTPLPAGNQSLRLWYAPAFTPLVNDSDAFEGINGWEEWAVNDVAMKARVKEESAIDDLLKLQAVQNDRLESIMENRDAGAPATVVDVYRANGYGDGYGGDWGP